MKYWIRIHNVGRGPYSAAEIVETFGPILPSNTPCAEVGHNTWRTLGELLPEIGSASPIPELSQPPSPIVDQLADGVIKKMIGLPVIAVTGLISVPIFLRYERTDEAIWGWLFFIVIVLGVSASIVIPICVLAKHADPQRRSLFRTLPFIHYFFRNGGGDRGNPFTQKD